MSLLDPKSQDNALSLLMNFNGQLEMKDSKVKYSVLKVLLWYLVARDIFMCFVCLLTKHWEILLFLFQQVCVDIYNAMQNKEFGKCEEKIVEFQAKCHAFFPNAVAFGTPAVCSNHVNNVLPEKEDESWWRLICWLIAYFMCNHDN